MPLDRAKVADAIKFINGMPEGEMVIGYLLGFCHVFQTSMPKNCDPNMTLYNEGQRSVGNEIVSLLVTPGHKFKADTLKKIAGQAEGTSLD